MVNELHSCLPFMQHPKKGYKKEEVSLEKEISKFQSIFKRVTKALQAQGLNSLILSQAVSLENDKDV